MEASVLALAPNLGVKTDSIIKKATELARIAESKWKSSSLSSLNVSSTSIAVMCLELAATHNSQHVDRDAAIRLSTLTKKTYLTAFKFVQQMLDMRQDTSISNLSIQFGCSEAKKLAEQILSRYQSSQSNLDLADFNAELFNAASLYAACKKLKFKIDKAKIVASVGIKKSVFDRLVLQFEKIAAEVIGTKENPCTNEVEVSRNLADSIEQVSETFESGEAVSVGKLTKEDEEEDYQTWKKRILSQARAALAQK